MGDLEKAYILILVESNNKDMSIAKQSMCIKRIIISTLAAETLTMVDIPEVYLFYQNLLSEPL